MGVLKCAISRGHDRRPMVARKNTACGARQSSRPGGRREQQNKPAQQNGAHSRGWEARSAHAPIRSRAQRGKAARTLTAAHVIASAETTSPARRPAPRFAAPPRTAVNVDSSAALRAHDLGRGPRAFARLDGGVGLVRACVRCGLQPNIAKHPLCLKSCARLRLSHWRSFYRDHDSGKQGLSVR